MSRRNESCFDGSLTNQSVRSVSGNPMEDAELGSTQDPCPESSGDDFWQEASEMTIKVGCPIIIICGTGGNILTLLVLRRMRSDSPTFALFFTALTLSDLALIYVGLLPVWVQHQFDYAIQNSFRVTCKLIHWLFYCFGTLSAWLLAAMTIQRAVSVVWPHKVRSTCTKRQGYITIAALVLTIFAIESNILYAIDIHPEVGICFFTDSYVENFLYTWVWLDLLVVSFLPFIVLLLSNAVLIWSVVRSVRRASQCLVGERGAGQLAEREKKLSSMSVTLLTVSTAFILLTSPIAFLSLIMMYKEQASFDIEIKYPYMNFVQAVTNLLWYTNSAINWALYILTGARFRQELRAVLGLCGFSQ